MKKLYPSTEPYKTHKIEVDSLHKLYVEECGCTGGEPIVFLHGGPGAGCESYHRRFFDPTKYRIILFDQRGCGRSSPHAELKNNTTWDLVADMEVIRQHLNIEKWSIFGGSWGSTLALTYAETHVERVRGLILRGIFLARKQDVDWFYQQGASRVFPEYWQDFIQPVAEADRHNMVQAYYRLLTSDDEGVRVNAAKAWSIWEGRTASLVPNPNVLNHFGDPYAALSIARIECHYFVNNSFLEPDQLLRDAHKIRHIPTYIVQGQYDMICPVEQAWVLHQALPDAKLDVIADAGHSVMEAGITQALLKATSEMIKNLEK
jgi:proline iminopeptidase